MTIPTDLPREELLLKILKMTTSDNDNIALGAIRKANALLQSAGWDWDKLITSKIKVVHVESPFKNMSVPPARPADPYGKPFAPQQAQQAYTSPTPPPRPQYTPPPPPPPPRTVPPVSSTERNRYAGSCYCCGLTVKVSEGYLFDPSVFQPRATSTKRVICTGCNNDRYLSFPARPAKAKLSLSDLDI